MTALHALCFVYAIVRALSLQWPVMAVNQLEYSPQWDESRTPSTPPGNESSELWQALERSCSSSPCATPSIRSRFHNAVHSLIHRQRPRGTYVIVPIVVVCALLFVPGMIGLFNLIGVYD